MNVFEVYLLDIAFDLSFSKSIEWLSDNESSK
jgi:hypothetical protein